MKKLRGFGLPSVQVDGTNVLDIYEVNERSCSPRTQRLMAQHLLKHLFTAGEATAAREMTAHQATEIPSEVRQWEQYCPINTYRRASRPK